MATSQILFLLSCLGAFSAASSLKVDSAVPSSLSASRTATICFENSECPDCNIYWTDSAGVTGGANAPSFDIAIGTGLIIRVKRMVGDPYTHGLCYCDLDLFECDVWTNCAVSITFLGMAEVGGAAIPAGGYCLKATRSGGAGTGSASYAAGDYNQTDNLLSASVAECGNSDTVTIKLHSGSNCTTPGTVLMTYTFTLACNTCDSPD